MSSQLVASIKPSQIPGSDPQSTKYLIVPIFIFFALLIFAMIRGPQIISGSGIGTAIMVSTPLILATYGPRGIKDDELREKTGKKNG